MTQSQTGNRRFVLASRAVGVAGGAEKCRYAVEELGFDACIDHYADDFAEQLAGAASFRGRAPASVPPA